MVVVSDTSPLTNLLKINRLDLLPTVFQKIIIPEKVLEEIRAWHEEGLDISPIVDAKWLEVRACGNQEMVQSMSRELDPGEAEALVLARELNASFLLIDERKGWKIAKAHGINAIGLVGVLLKAKSQGEVSHVMPIIDDLRQKAGFWIGAAFYEQIKTLAKET